MASDSVASRTRSKQKNIDHDDVMYSQINDFQEISDTRLRYELDMMGLRTGNRRISNVMTQKETKDGDYEGEIFLDTPMSRYGMRTSDDRSSPYSQDNQTSDRMDQQMRFRVPKSMPLDEASKLYTSESGSHGSPKLTSGTRSQPKHSHSQTSESTGVKTQMRSKIHNVTTDDMPNTCTDEEISDIEEMQADIRRMEAKLTLAKDRASLRAKQRQIQLQDEIKPEDSVSNVTSKTSKSSTSSIQRAKVKEIELAAKVLTIKRSNEIQERKRQLHQRMEELIRQRKRDAAAYRANEEMRLLKEEEEEMQIRKVMEEEEERLSRIEQEMALETEYHAAQAATRALASRNFDSMSQVASTEHSSYMDIKGRPVNKDTHVMMPGTMPMGRQSTDLHTRDVHAHGTPFDAAIHEKIAKQHAANANTMKSAPKNQSFHCDQRILCHDNTDACTTQVPVCKNIRVVKVEDEDEINRSKVAPQVHADSKYMYNVDVSKPHEEDERLVNVDRKRGVYDDDEEGGHERCMRNFDEDQLKSGDEQMTNQNTLVKVLDKLVNQQRLSALPKPEIEIFDGKDSTEFPAFMRNYKYVVETKTKDPVRKLELLCRFTRNEPHDLIKNCVTIEPPEAGYKRALYLLQREYGQSAVLATAYMKKAENWRSIKSGDRTALNKFYIFVTSISSAKQSNQDLDGTDGFEFLHMLASKLPIPLQQKWIGEVGKLREQHKSPMLVDFERFIGQLARDENDPRIKGLGYQARQNKASDNRSGRNTHVFAATVGSPQNRTYSKPANDNKSGSFQNTPVCTKKSCVYCGPDTKHVIKECRKFSTLSLEEKSNFCRTKGLCYGCLKAGHTRKQCKYPEKCTKCSRRHPTSLHNPNLERKTSDKDTDGHSAAVKVTTGCVNAGCTRLTILPVTVSTAGGQCIKTYAFLDNGCGAVFASPELCAKLNVRMRNTKIRLKTLASEQMCDTMVVQDRLQVGDLHGDNFVDLPDVFVKDMPVTNEDIPMQRDINKLRHLRNIELPDLKTDEDRQCVIPRVSMMIGNNVKAASQPLEIRTGNMGDPYAVKTPLGWTIHGLVSSSTERSVAAHFCGVATSIQRSNEHLEQLFTSYVNQDFNEKTGNETRPSVQDKKFLKMMDESVNMKNGHYEVMLPFKDRSFHVPNNRPQAEMYAKRLSHRLKKDDKLHEKYTTFMNDLSDKGYCEQVPESELNKPDRVWYIPHHPVFNPNKPDKVRVVFNCPVTYHGTSLNQQLLQGTRPDKPVTRSPDEMEKATSSSDIRYRGHVLPSTCKERRH